MPLDTGEGVVVCPKPVYVSQDPRISKINKCGVNKEAGGVSRVEDVKVSVLDPTAVEVGGGVSFGVERGGILSLTLAPSAD